MKNNRGSALLESIPLMITLLLFIAGLCLTAYLFFMRAWIQYQSEQTLYCVAQGNSVPDCQMQLHVQLERFLPWGEFHLNVQGTGDNWTVEVTWKYQDYGFHMRKILNPALIRNAKALRW